MTKLYAEEVLSRSVHIKHELSLETQADGKPVWFVLDTGSFYSVLDASQIGRLGLGTERLVSPRTGSLIADDYSTLIIGLGKTGAHPAKVTTLKTLQLGRCEWKNIHLGISNLRAWHVGGGHATTTDVQGLLGADLLIGRGVLIDFASRKTWLRQLTGS